MRIEDINSNDKKYIRAGIIPFIRYQNSKIYAFGLGNVTGDICDFGGHKDCEDNDLIDTAIREYNEESFGIFGNFNRESLKNSEVIDGVDTIEILVEVNGNISDYNRRFKNILNNNYNHEIQDIIWLSKKQLLVAIDSEDIQKDGVKIFHMYSKIRNVLSINRNKI